MTLPIHRRTNDVPPELRGDRRLCFYAAVFDVPVEVTEFGETFTEVIRRGAFARSLAAGVDLPATIEHDGTREFARTTSGLLLQEDDRGLFASVYLPPSPANDRIIADVRAGKLNGASFAARDKPGGRRRTEGSPRPVHEVLDAELLDVTLSAGRQVYRETVVSLRARPADSMVALRLRRLKLAALTP